MKDEYEINIIPIWKESSLDCFTLTFEVGIYLLNHFLIP